MRILNFAALALAATALETTSLEVPKVEASTVFPVDGWGVTDWTVGLMMGAYAPLQTQWRDSDCRSQFYNFGMRAMPFSEYFDQPFDLTSAVAWIGVIFKTASIGLAIYQMVDICAAQYKDTFSDQWYLNFNFLTEDFTPVVEASTYTTT